MLTVVLKRRHRSRESNRSRTEPVLISNRSRPVIVSKSRPVHLRAFGDCWSRSQSQKTIWECLTRETHYFVEATKNNCFNISDFKTNKGGGWVFIVFLKVIALLCHREVIVTSNCQWKCLIYFHKKSMTFRLNVRIVKTDLISYLVGMFNSNSILKANTLKRIIEYQTRSRHTK